MLIELNIKNFALIDEVRIEFQKGLNILTGETGAGKSILVDALTATMGEYFESDYIKSGEKVSTVEALFNISDNNSLKETLANDDNLVISRDITQNRGSIYRLQGQLTTLSFLKNITKNLVDIHSQFENQSLLQVSNHLILLDRFGKEKIKKLKEEVKVLFEKLTTLKKERDNLKKAEKEDLRNYDINKYQVEEIEKANLKIGEDKYIEEKLTFLQNAEKIKEVIDYSYRVIYSKENSALEYLQSSLNKIKEVKSIDATLSPIFENIQNSIIYIEEATSLLQKYISNFDFSENKLQELDDRLDLIRKLKRKYGETPEEILNYKDKIKQQIDNFENKEERIKDTEMEIEGVEKELATKCGELSQSRKEVAKKLKNKVEKELNDLAMKGAIFDISIKYKEDKDGINYENKIIAVKNTGWDEVEFLISPNIGEPLKPLNKIASGGELSRVMLAIKSSLQEVDEVSVLIFDEVDAGIGGEAGVKIGEKLYQLSKNHQVICITHLPTIACFADNHLQVSKNICQNKTKIIVKHLSYKEKVEELSRMLRGKEAGEITKSDAEDLLKMSEGKKKQKEIKNVKT